MSAAAGATMSTDLVAIGPRDARDASELQHIEADTGRGPVPGRFRSVRFPGLAASREQLERWRRPGWDLAVVESEAALQDFAVLAMDMDSTLIGIECIDELADLAGRKDEVAEITALAMRGDIPFAESLRRRVHLLAGLPESALERVYEERLRINSGGAELIQAARDAGLRTLLVSGGFTWFASRVQRALGIDECAANVLELQDGRLTGRVAGRLLDAQGKARALQRTARSVGAGEEELLCIGDGANDIPMLAFAGVSIAFHAKAVVRAATTHILDHADLDAVLALYPPRT